MTTHDHLFDPSGLRRLTHTDDPAPSHEAAAEMDASGVLSGHLRIVLNLVTKYPDHTGAELHALSDLPDLYQIRRRLSDLKDMGWIIRGEHRKCRVRGRSSCTWRVR